MTKRGIIEIKMKYVVELLNSADEETLDFISTLKEEKFSIS